MCNILRTGLEDVMYFVGWGSSSEEGCVARGGGHHIIIIYVVGSFDGLLMETLSGL